MDYHNFFLKFYCQTASKRRCKLRQIGDNPGVLGGLFPSTLRVGGMDKNQLLQALREQRIEINDVAKDLFLDRRFEILRQSSVVEIEYISLSELGLADGATYRRLTESARRVGLVECPLELGPYLRLQFLGQPEGAIGFPVTQNTAPYGSITVATSPLDDIDETPRGFYLRRIKGVLWLRGYRSSPCHVWSPDDIFVFARNTNGF